MFYPQSMTELELIVPAKDMVVVTKTLAGQVAFHQIDTSYLSTDSQHKSDDSWPQRASGFTALERRILNLMQALGIDRSQPPPLDQMTTIELDAARPAVDQIEADVRSVTDRQSEENRRLDQRKTYLTQLQPVSDLDIDIDLLQNSRYIASTLGTIPRTNLERLQMSLVRIPFVFLTLRQKEDQAIVWIAGPQKNAEVLERASRSAYLNPLHLPESYHGTLSQVVKTIQAEMEEIKAAIAEQGRAIEKMCQRYEAQLQALFWQVNASRILADAIAHFGRLQHTYLIYGWVPTGRLETLIERLKQASKSIVIETFPVKRAGVPPDVPVTLYSSWLLRPFQSLVTTFAQPRYDEVDPTILMALTFPILFGAMFGDVGHGIELALVGMLLSSRKVKFLQSLSGLGRLVTICGIFAALFGFLYGSVFGIENLIPALWMHPITNILQILAVSVGAGVVLLTIGYLIGIINAFIARDWGRFFFDHNGLAGLLLYR
jgi:V/A-type H+-transporting ATPase subunit I